MATNNQKSTTPSNKNRPETAQEFQHQWALRTPKKEFNFFNKLHLEHAAATTNGNERDEYIMQ